MNQVLNMQAMESNDTVEPMISTMSVVGCGIFSTWSVVACAIAVQ